VFTYKIFDVAQCQKKKKSRVALKSKKLCYSCEKLCLTLWLKKTEQPKTENPNLEDWDFSLTLTTNNHKTKFFMHWSNPSDDKTSFCRSPYGNRTRVSSV